MLSCFSFFFLPSEGGRGGDVLCRAVDNVCDGNEEGFELGDIREQESLSCKNDALPHSLMPAFSLSLFVFDSTCVVAARLGSGGWAATGLAGVAARSPGPC